MFKVNNKDTRTTHWHRSDVFIVNFDTPCSNISIINFEQVNTGWVGSITTCQARSKSLDLGFLKIVATR